MKLDQTTRLIAETISALMVIADEDDKQNKSTSSFDVLEMLTITKNILKHNLAHLPATTFKSDPFLNRHFQYTNKECVDAINKMFTNTNNKHPFSVYTIFKSRVIPAILQTFKHTQSSEFVDIYFEYLLSVSTEEEITLQTAFQLIIKTSRQQLAGDRLNTIRSAALKLTEKM